MPDALNPWILARTQALSPGGVYRFEPGPRGADPSENPRDPWHDGVTRSLRIGGIEVARAAPDGATFCCGITFEVWLDAYREGRGADPVVPDPQVLLAEWFCPTIGHGGVAEALSAMGLGDRIGRDEAIPGDLVQYWRSVDLDRPSGHSAVFLGWGDGPVMRYWSSQPATGGIGVHQEPVGSDWQLHFVRAR